MSEFSKAGASIAKRVQDPLCSMDELDALVGTSAKVDRLIASHSNTSGNTLQKLSRSRDKKSREAVANNPNTPLEVLIDLASDFPRAFLLHPTFDLVVLKDPGVLESLYASTLANLLQQKECPLSIIQWAVAFYSKQKRINTTIFIGIVRNTNVPVDIIDAVLRLDSHAEITGTEGFL